MQIHSDIKIPDLILDKEYEELPSEYDTVVAAVTHLYKTKRRLNSRGSDFFVIDKIAIWEGDYDIEVVACQTGIDKEKLKILVNSSKLQKRAYEQKFKELSTEIFYGLEREGIIPDISKVSFWKTKNIKKTLEAAVKSNIISNKPFESLVKIIEELNAFMAHEALNNTTSGGNLTADLIKLSIHTKKDQVTFMKLFFDNDGPIDEFWKNLHDKPKFLNHQYNDSTVNTILTTFQIAELTHNNIPLVKALLDLKKDSPMQSIQELTALVYDDWVKLFENAPTSGAKTKTTKKENIPIPPEIPGDSHKEKVSNYIKLIIDSLESSFPAPYIIRKIIQPSLSVDVDLVRKVIELNPTFDPHFSSS